MHTPSLENSPIHQSLPLNAFEMSEEHQVETSAEFNSSESNSAVVNSAVSSSTASKSAQKLTPLMQQYWDIKSAHEDKIVLFRMGDFFEMFHRDAETAAPVLGIALTARNKNSGDTTPMCGVPHHSVANSINKLLANGFKVAICDQIEDPKLAKGLVKRAVTRILSPGVVFDPDTLDSVTPNYLASRDAKSVSFLDATTGEAFYFHVKDPARQLKLLRSLQPVEILIGQEAERSELAGLDAMITLHEGLWSASRVGAGVVPSTVSNQASNMAPNSAPVMDTTSALGPSSGSAAAAWPESARRLVGYAIHMHGGSAGGGEKVLETISPFESRELLDRMDLPQTVIRHLEIFETYKGETRGTLFDSIHRCKTSSGARLLKQWLTFPLAQMESIERRLDRVEFWYRRPEETKRLRSLLGGMGDIQRRLAKLGNPSCHPRDLLALAQSLNVGLEVSRVAAMLLSTSDSQSESMAGPLGGPPGGKHSRAEDTAEAVAREILATIVDEPPVQLKNGGIVRQGVRKDLDELIELSTNSNKLIMDLEARERETTGISSLKVRFNSVFGYYIEITNTHKNKVPTDRYERKQTLANAERYLTRELAELESKVLSAQAKRLELESAIFQQLVDRCLRSARDLQALASQWAEIDVVSSLAWLALEQNYCRPHFNSEGRLSLRGSRHPVIEQSLSVPFVANDIELPRNGCLLLTGPNMAGKSTLMRQVALAALLAQVGSFVPAREAELPIFDRIFTRIGASDFLSEGLSTFMVEMKETAEMLESISEHSLVVLDEVGRGTSTYDGMSLAQSILEFILDHRRSMTFFATHYHELTELATRHSQLFNAHMAIHERVGAQGAEITFLHQLMKGPASKSYGIHVAKLAGLPAAVTKRAASILKKLEAGRVESTLQMSMLGLLERSEDELGDLLEVNLSEISPMAARSMAASPMDVGPMENRTANPSPLGTNLDSRSLDEVCANDGLKPEVRETIEALKSFDLTRVTPLDALNQIAKWQQSLS